MRIHLDLLFRGATSHPSIHTQQSTCASHSDRSLIIIDIFAVPFRVLWSILNSYSCCKRTQITSLISPIDYRVLLPSSSCHNLTTPPPPPPKLVPKQCSARCVRTFALLRISRLAVTIPPTTTPFRWWMCSGSSDLTSAAIGLCLKLASSSYHASVSRSV